RCELKIILLKRLFFDVIIYFISFKQVYVIFVSDDFPLFLISLSDVYTRIFSRKQDGVLFRQFPAEIINQIIAISFSFDFRGMVVSFEWRLYIPFNIVVFVHIHTSLTKPW